MFGWLSRSAAIKLGRSAVCNHQNFGRPCDHVDADPAEDLLLAAA